jgi:transcriptional regulator with XRE-family HTH domain
MRSPAIEGLTPDLRQILQDVGKNISIARRRRRISQQELAERAQISLPTMRQVEKGSPSVGMGILLKVLYILQLHEQFHQLANPSTDEIGQGEELRRLPEKAFAEKSLVQSFLRRKS